MYGRQPYDLDKNLYKREINWNQRFVLEKIPKFNAYNDINYVSLGLFKSKIRYEERIKKEEAKSKFAGRIYSAHYMKPKSTSKISRENRIYNNTINVNNKKPRYPSMRISLDPTVNFNNVNSKMERHKILNNFHYQGTLTSQYVAGGNIFNYIPDYKNRNLKVNIRNIICEEDPEIAEEYEIVKELWEKLGVTENYVNNFDFILNGKSNDRDSVLEMIIGEKKQMKKFRFELMKVISEITKRENKINDLKQFIKTYEQIEELIKQKEKEKKKENNEITENKDEKNLKKSKNIGEVNKELIENDIHDCLKSLRLRTINTVNIITKFKTAYFNLFNNKINLEFIKKKYGFNDKYLVKLNNDLDFLKNTIIKKIYHFSEKGGDPFLLCISDKCGDPADIPQYRQLPISNEILSVVKNFKFSLEQEEVFSMIKNKNNKNSNNSNISYKYKSNVINAYKSPYNKNNMNVYNNAYSTEYNNPITNSFSSYNRNNIKFNNYNTNFYNNNKYDNKLLLNDKKIFGSNNNFFYNKNNSKNNINENLLSSNFKGDVENEKLKLKAQNEYRNVFFNTEEKGEDDILLNQSMNNQPKRKEEENKYELPGMTSKQLYRHLAKYNKIKREIFPPFNKELIKEEVQKNIIQKIEDRMNKVEKDFNSKMDDKFKNEEKKIREEEIRLKNEKEKIEKLRIEEEEERKKKEEKYFKFEEERTKRKNMDKKKKEENERLAKRENDLFLREMQMKFMKEVDERFKKESDRQFELKREEINDAEIKDKKRKEAIERIRNGEFQKIKKGEVLVDLRNEEDRIKIGDVITNSANVYENSNSNSINKEEKFEKNNNEDVESESKNDDEDKNGEDENKSDKDKNSKKNYISNDDSESDKNNKDNSEESKNKSKNSNKKESSKNEEEEEEEEENNKNKKNNDYISEEMESI